MGVLHLAQLSLLAVLPQAQLIVVVDSMSHCSLNGLELAAVLSVHFQSGFE